MGIFVTNKVVKIADVTDGTSNTAMISEAILGDGDQTRYRIRRLLSIELRPGRSDACGSADSFKRVPRPRSDCLHDTVVVLG